MYELEKKLNKVDKLKKYHLERIITIEDDNNIYWDRKIYSLLSTYKPTIKYLDMITVKTGYVYKIYETENIDFSELTGRLLLI